MIYKIYNIKKLLNWIIEWIEQKTGIYEIWIYRVVININNEGANKLNDSQNDDRNDDTEITKDIK